MEEILLLAPEAVLNENLLASVNQRTFFMANRSRNECETIIFCKRDAKALIFKNETHSEAFQVQGIYTRVIANL